MALVRSPEKSWFIQSLPNIKLKLDIVQTNILVNSHVIQLTRTIFKLNSHIKKTNVLTKFHENWAKNVTSRVFTCLHYIHIEKNAPPIGGHVFSPIWTILKFVRDINKTNETNVLTKFNENWAKKVTSRVFTCFHYIHYREKCPAHWQPCFFTDLDQFQTRRDIIWTNLLTKFHEDRTINVASRVFTNKCGQTTDHGQRLVTKAHRSNQLAQTNQPTNRPTNQQTNQQTNRQGKNNMSPPTIFQVKVKTFACDKQTDSQTHRAKTITGSLSSHTDVQIQLVTKFGEDQMKFRDRPTDGQTDKMTPI
ncbi:hypothetical protein DPMN_100784 [Dreissena polymorpha]|uniref:Uncharacterized protein n=1 Tax=Dreissena polymorpha TaxID=45954 RepID=A0A9D4R7R4_DREPO|nr:hypothetical protein DPMN_100784 [Dreissena polymorpha]